MVSSKLNKTINYPEKRIIDEEDKGFQSSLYELDLGFPNEVLSVVIVLGKPKYTYSSKNVVFYPIYVVANDDSRIKIKSQIGVFEIEGDRVLSVLDEDNDIDSVAWGSPQ